MTSPKLPLSFSKLQDFRGCPQRFAHRYIWKDVPKEDWDAPHLLKGRRIDDALSRAVSVGGAIPVEVPHVEPIITALRGMHDPQTKVKVAFNDALREVEYFRGGPIHSPYESTTPAGGPGIMWRLEFDVRAYYTPTHVAAVVVDWKTGKVGKDEGQLSMYAGAQFALDPICNTVVTYYVWVEHKKVLRKVYLRSQMAEIWDPLYAQARNIHDAIETDNFPPKESWLCKFCPVTAAQCKFKK